MKKFLGIMCAALLAFGLTGVSNATLWDRGGGLIYDDVLDITWLQDADYAKTSGYDPDGYMNWYEAITWADQLVYGGYNDWRLPHVLPVNGSSYVYSVAYDGSADFGYNISAPESAYPGSTGSELAYMYYNNLANVGYYDTIGNGPQPGWSYDPNANFTDGNGNPVSFQNLQHDYWSGTEYPINSNGAWYFTFTYDLQDISVKGSYTRGWAVRPGDSSPIPIPSSLFLLGTGVVGLVGFKKKFKKK